MASFYLRFIAISALLLMAVTAAGCATIDPSRVVVDRFRIHGTHRVDSGDLRNHLATRETERVPILGLRWPFADPAYYDAPTFRRDQQRIVRYYETRGYYSSRVASSSVTPLADGHRVALDVAVQEGTSTRVTRVQLAGCDPDLIVSGERWPIPKRVCKEMRSQMQIRPGVVFKEETFHADQELLEDLLKDAGRAIAHVEPRAEVDPQRHEASVVFALSPGPPSQFGTTELLEGMRNRPAENGVLPVSGYPVAPALRTINIRPGAPYNRVTLATLQRRLFDLGAFGIVRVEEIPHRCDSRGRCDDARDPNDPNEYVRVDLQLHVTGARQFRLRLGAGAEANQLLSDVHLLVSAEHRNFLGGMRQLRVEDRPLVFFPPIFGTSGGQQFDLGNLLTIELRQPGIWLGGASVISASWDFGPDPFNPGLTDRSRASAAAGVNHTFDRQLHAAAYVRATRVDYYSSFFNGSDSHQVDIDPIFKSQYRPATQSYTYLEQQFTWDRRDVPLASRRGTYLAALLQEGAPVLGDYAFVRSTLEARGYVPLGGGFVLAARGYAGAAIGLSADVNGWPVPQELRFYSGGANSNRGYAFNRVGPIITAPAVNCSVPSSTGPTTVPYYDVRCRTSAAGPPYSLYVQDHNTVPDVRRTLSVGGLTLWEASLELRWYHDPFGLVLFFDASDVTGWMAPQYNPNNPNDPASAALRRPDPIRSVADVAMQTPVLPGAQSLQFSFDPHPSAGLGARYISPIGVIRVDLGFRLDDLGCTAYPNAIRQQNVATLGQPWYYTAHRPQCDILNLPIALNFALGEAY